MMYTVDEVIKKYVEIRDRKKLLADKQAAEMQPLNDAQMSMENWLMHQMNTLGVDQLKAASVGTAYKSTAVSVQLKEPKEFKQFIFEPVVQGITRHLLAMGIHVDDRTVATIASFVSDLPRWDMVDFRAGKKGIQEYQETNSAVVPGVSINSVATVNIRRA